MAALVPTILIKTSICSVVLFSLISAFHLETESRTDTSSLSNKKKSSDSLNSAVQGKATIDTVKYEADIIDYDITQKKIFLRNNGVVHYKNMILYADSISLMFEKNLLTASGKPMLVEDADTVIGEQMNYNLKTGRGSVHYGTAHSMQERYNGIDITRSDDKNFYIENGDYTSCTIPDSSHYFFYARNVKIIPNDKAVGRPAILALGDAPIAWLPYFALPLRSGRQSGWLIPKFGGHPSYHGYLDNFGYYWAPNDYVDVTVSSRIYEFSQFLASVQTSYALRYWLTGSISTRYAWSASMDTVSKLWELNYSHSQNLSPDESMKLTGIGSIVSSKNFFVKTSIDTAELLNQNIQAMLTLQKNFTELNAYTNIIWNRNHNFKSNVIDQDLPSFSFNWNTRPLWSKPSSTPNALLPDKDDSWYSKINYSYSIAGKNKLSYSSQDEKPKKQFHSRHAGVTHQIPISGSYTLLNYFKLTPAFEIHQSLFDAYIDTTSRYDTISDTLQSHTIIDSIVIGTTKKFIFADSIIRIPVIRHDTTNWYEKNFHPSKAQIYWWSTGISLSTTLYGLFPLNLFHFTGLRHTLTPRIGYSYVPKSSTNLDKRYPAIENVSVVQNKNSQQIVRFDVDNLFQGRISKTVANQKEPVDQKFTLLSANIGSSYDFLGKIRKWSDIGLGCGIPNKYINFAFQASFRPYNAQNTIDRPHLMSYSFSLSPTVSSLNGTFWSGDLILLDSVHTNDYLTFVNKNKQGWNMSFSPSYSFSQTRAQVTDDFTSERTYRFGASANLSLSTSWAMSWSSSYDFTTSKFMNHSLAFTCDRDCWDLAFNWNPSGINQGSFYFIVKIKKHPELKWDRRDSD